jgi:hypothetical protein
MAQEKPLPMTAEQAAWVHRRLAEMAAFCAICAEVAENDYETSALAAMMALYQSNAQSMSRQGVAEWQNVASQVLTIIIEEVEHHASDSQRSSASGPRGDFYRTLAMSLRTDRERSGFRAD